MFFFDYRLFDKVKRSRGYDPKYPDQQSFMKDLKNRLRLDFGICSEIQDPDGKLRVKVHFPHWGQNIISDWVPIIRPFGGTQFGFSSQPEVGDKLICMFINGDRSHPIVVGGVYNKGIAHPPFKMKEGNHIRAFTSRTGSKIVFNDEDGEEKIQIYMKDGKIRGTFSKSKGIALVNELGDIKVKCRKLTIEAGDAATIKFKKQLKITCDQENLTMKSKKGIEFVAGMDVKFKGSKIKMKGMAAAQFKAVAKEGDQVVGVDIHMVKVPAPPGSPIPTPLPHPYVGKLDTALSQDVVLDNKAVAYKGSKCNHISPGHIPTPPGIAWEGAAPSNKGEITNLTVPNVKVNNKEIAVLGSMVKTCNFPSDMETCTVVAVGAAVKVPMMIPGLPADQFTKDQGAVINTRDLVSQRSPANPPPTPTITSVEWSSGAAKVGEEVTLTANLSNQYPNAAVYFEIFKEGEEKPFKKLNCTISGNKGEVKWRYYYVHDPANPLTAKPKFKFKASSFKCEPKESSAIEMSADVNVKVTVDGTAAFTGDVKVISADGSESSFTPDSDGLIEIKDVVPGPFELLYEPSDESDSSSSEVTKEEIAEEPAAEEEERPAPQFSDLKWKKAGSDTDSAKIGDEVELEAKAENMNQGEEVTITIYEKDEDSEDDFLRSVNCTVGEEGKISFSWEVEFMLDDDEMDSDKGMPEYIFKLATTDKSVESEESPVLECSDDFEQFMFDADGEPLDGQKVKLLFCDGSSVETEVKEGRIFEEDVPPGNVRIIFI